VAGRSPAGAEAALVADAGWTDDVGAGGAGAAAGAPTDTTGVAAMGGATAAGAAASGADADAAAEGADVAAAGADAAGEDALEGTVAGFFAADVVAGRGAEAPPGPGGGTDGLTALLGDAALLAGGDAPAVSGASSAARFTT
jgi:hypothetical protein